MGQIGGGGRLTRKSRAKLAGDLQRALDRLDRGEIRISGHDADGQDHTLDRARARLRQRIEELER